MRPLSRANLGADAHDLVLDAGDASTETITPGDETEPGSGGSDEPDGGGSPPATGVASPAQPGRPRWYRRRGTSRGMRPLSLG